jgi:hypothetical protein
VCSPIGPTCSHGISGGGDAERRRAPCSEPARRGVRVYSASEPGEAALAWRRRLPRVTPHRALSEALLMHVREERPAARQLASPYLSNPKRHFLRHSRSPCLLVCLLSCSLPVPPFLPAAPLPLSFHICLPACLPASSRLCPSRFLPPAFDPLLFSFSLSPHIFSAPRAARRAAGPVMSPRARAHQRTPLPQWRATAVCTSLSYSNFSVFLSACLSD